MELTREQEEAKRSLFYRSFPAMARDISSDVCRTGLANGLRSEAARTFLSTTLRAGLSGGLSVCRSLVCLYFLLFSCCALVRSGNLSSKHIPPTGLAVQAVLCCRAPLPLASMLGSYGTGQWTHHEADFHSSPRSLTHSRLENERSATGWRVNN